MKTIVLVAFISLAKIPGVFPAPLRISARLGSHHRALFLRDTHSRESL